MPTPREPNVRRLIAERAATLQIEKAKEKYGNADVGSMAMCIMDGTFQECLREAALFVKGAIKEVRKATARYHYLTDEEIAVEILRKLDERKAGKK